MLFFQLYFCLPIYYYHPKPKLINFLRTIFDIKIIYK